MIHRARFQNFKALRDVEITFDSRLTVLVGPNGSGKTSVLQGIHYLTLMARENNTEPEYQFQNLLEYRSLSSVPGEPYVLQLEGTRSGEEGRCGITLTDDGKGHVAFALSIPGVPSDESPRILATGQASGGAVINIAYRSRPLPAFSQLRFDHSLLVRFSARQLALPTLVRSYPPQVAKDGLGLAATLGHIKSKYPERFDAIIAAFRRVIPNVRGVRFDKERVPDTQYYEDILLVDYKGADGVRASHVSSGTLFALGLLTIALGPDSANIILLDDLDHGLHPKAQMELIDVFRGLIEQNPELQIIATAHSPYILNQLEWNEVRVTSLGDDGAVICKPLTDHPEFERWKESMTPGEFWSTFYEDWLTKTRKPQPVS